MDSLSFSKTVYVSDIHKEKHCIVFNIFQGVSIS